MLYWSKYIYNVEFSFVKACIHFFGGPCIWGRKLSPWLGIMNTVYVHYIGQEVRYFSPSCFYSAVTSKKVFCIPGFFFIFCIPENRPSAIFWHWLGEPCYVILVSHTTGWIVVHATPRHTRHSIPYYTKYGAMLLKVVRYIRSRI
jgi:hypothetical protein